MTEDDAKTKWCPMRRITRIGDVQIDNTDGKEFTLNCIGSACMMWQHDSAANVPTGKEIVVKGLDGMSRFEPETRVELSGHCGLAGQPMPPLIRIKTRDLTAGELNALKGRALGKGVYNNPQPGDTDWLGV